MQTKSTGRSGFLNLRSLIVLLLCAATACFVLIPIRSGLASHHPQAPANASQRSLTFEERVSYQRAIEEVYWRHRIWPKERKDPKPSLDAVMSQAQLERKVADYLRNSQALEDYWQHPIKAEQLQAEMDRMAQHTKQPEVLSELFEALGNDPFVIAECLARPALAERLVTNWYAYDQRIHGELKKHAQADLRGHNNVEQMKQTSGKYSEIELVRSDRAQEKDNRGAEHGVKMNSREWDETVQKLAAMFGDTTNVTARTGVLSRAVAAGVSPAKGAPIAQIKTGVLSPLQENESRYYATAVVRKTSDRVMLATVTWLKEPFESWRASARNQLTSAVTVPLGNYKLPKISDTTSGCIDDTWTATPGPPDDRDSHTAVWTGSEVIIWGGYGGGSTGSFLLNTGGRYNPGIDSWTTTSTTDVPDARTDHTAVWTGSEMIVWGGQDNNSNFLNTGGRYNPGTNSWAATSTTNAPTPRTAHTAVWTGSEMVVWGGDNGSSLNTGGRYNPGTDSWTATSIANTPAARSGHTAVWTDSEMIVWGGYDGSYANTGGRYNPNTDSWTPTSVTNAPSGRVSYTAVWTGSEMIVWGGLNNTGYLNTGGRYNPVTDSWMPTSTANAPAIRSVHTAVWTGSEIIIWGGYFFDGSEHYLNTGGKYNPGTNSWIATSTTSAPTGRELHTGIWTGSEMIVWGGTGAAFVLNTGGRYNPSTDSWTNTGTSNTPSGRSSHTAIWTGSEMIVWGGADENFPFFLLNTGGRYSPSTDAWTATSTTNAAAARYFHTAVWTGNEMIVWGGDDENFVRLDTGGRYDPGSDSWMATSITNAPSGRFVHTAVWAGNEMIVWGGIGDLGDLNTGGRYNPGSDGWAATSTTNAPLPREAPTAVWTGDEMIVWGGYNANHLNTGGRYNPSTDSWMATSIIDAPSERSSYTALWTGSEMVIWGGIDNSGFTNTGGRYNPSADTWTATSTATQERGAHTAVWTGSEMIVWGGWYDLGLLNTGGRYNPSTDSWTATNTTNAPAARTNHTAVWTASEMIVWGGYIGGYLNSGGRYCAQSGPTPTPTATPRVTQRPRPTPHRRPTPP